MADRKRNKLALRILGLWIWVGYPIAGLALLFDQYLPWMDHHPSIVVVMLATFIVPLLILGWLEYGRRKVQEAAACEVRVSQSDETAK